MAQVGGVGTPRLAGGRARLEDGHRADHAAFVLDHQHGGDGALAGHVAQGRTPLFPHPHLRHLARVGGHVALDQDLAHPRVIFRPGQAHLHLIHCAAPSPSAAQSA